MNVICKVCGANMKRLTATHLKTHKITLAEYNKMYSSDGGKVVAVLPSQLMAGLSDWVNTGKISDSVESVVNGLYSDPQSKLRMILMAVALARVNRLETLQGVIDRVSEKLYDEKRLSTASTWELMQILRLSQTETMEILGLFKDITLQAPPAGGDTFNFNIVGSTPVPDKADGRNKLYHFLSAVLKTAQSNDVPLSEQEEVIEVFPETVES